MAFSGVMIDKRAHDAASAGGSNKNVARCVSVQGHARPPRAARAWICRCSSSECATCAEQNSLQVLSRFNARATTSVPPHAGLYPLEGRGRAADSGWVRLSVIGLRESRSNEPTL
jgi:hypothetical protein